MLMKRVITALILIPLVLLGLFFASNELFGIACAVIVLIASWEWADLMALKTWITKLIFMILVMTAIYVATLLHFQIFLYVVIFWWVIHIFSVAYYPQSAKLWGNKFMLAIIGMQVLVPTWLCLVNLRELPHGSEMILYLLLLIWSADTGAYFVGKRFGKHKLAVKVSPGKTLEGVLGGLAASLVVAVIAGVFHNLDASMWWQWILLAVITALASVLGDLVESMVKRHRGVKDSSQLIPGHGGLLDRIDSLTAALPVFAIGIQLIGISHIL